jgi:hypothetical protein
MSDDREHLKLVTDEPLSIKKPGEFKLDAFKSTHDPSIANVETLITALPHHKIAEARDWTRLHPNEATHWTDELCFVSVPINGTKKDSLHLITQALAERYLPSKQILRFRLALAAKPFDIFYLCHVPSRNLDNVWNDTNLRACQQAKTSWVKASSGKDEGVEGYQIRFTRDQDAFPTPNWPRQSLDELILTTFNGIMITSEDHAALARLIGAKQSLA